jgi:NNP family nitrate/nitrite transporter-like MFS transporter
MSTTTTKIAGGPRLDARRFGRWIDDWRPEDPTFWKEKGAAIANRNLIYSVASEHIGFSVWTLWSVLVLFLGPDYGFDVSQKFLLTAVPSLLGSLVRVPYTFAVAVFGGRNWTVISAALLLVPTIAIAIVLEPGVSFDTLLWVSALAGVGGGNFASSMTNINAFYPSRLKGWALGVNAGGGNLGVAVVQLVGLAVLALTGTQHPRLMVAIYIPLIVLVATLAAIKMDNLSEVSNAKGAIREVATHKESWVLALLYIGTFGSFIGFSFAFGQVLLTQFPKEFPNPATAAALTFLGPLLGSLIRPVGGKLADRYTGSAVTLWTFLAMAVGTGIVLIAATQHSLALFVIGFTILFITSGLGNGSTYKMIPAIFMAKAQLAVGAGMPIPDANAEALRRSGALIGLAGAIGALGGFGVNLAFRQSFLSLGNANGAYLAFIGCYAICMAVTWFWFIRPRPARLQGV